MALRARKASGAFEKRAPALIGSNLMTRPTWSILTNELTEVPLAYCGLSILWNIDFSGILSWHVFLSLTRPLVAGRINFPQKRNAERDMRGRLFVNNSNRFHLKIVKLFITSAGKFRFLCCYNPIRKKLDLFKRRRSRKKKHRRSLSIEQSILNWPRFCRLWSLMLL